MRRTSLNATSIAEAVTNQLREELFTGTYEGGEEVRDTAVAERYGVARPTARVAVQQLITEGVLARRPGHSARVRTFDQAEVSDLFRVRRIIELDALREITEKSLPLERIGEALDDLARLAEKGVDDWVRLAEADVRFHSAVVHTSTSSRLQEQYRAITSETRLLIALLRDQYENGTELYDEHAHLFHLMQHAPLAELERAWVRSLESAEASINASLPLSPPPKESP